MVLPVVCVGCRAAYETCEAPRDFPWDHIDGYCPACLVRTDDRLFGHHAVTMEKQYCACGRQLITPIQIVTRRCECCAVGVTV